MQYILQTERREVGRVLTTEDEGGGAVRSKSDIQYILWSEHISGPMMRWVSKVWSTEEIRPLKGQWHYIEKYSMGFYQLTQSL